MVPIALKYAIDDLQHSKFPTSSVILFAVFRFGGEFLTELRTIVYAFVCTFNDSSLVVPIAIIAWLFN
jgi:hypothetical protein